MDISLLALRMLIGLISASPGYSVSQPFSGCPCKPVVLSFSPQLHSSHSLSPLSANLDAIYWPQKTTSPLHSQYFPLCQDKVILYKNIHTNINLQFFLELNVCLVKQVIEISLIDMGGRSLIIYAQCRWIRTFPGSIVDLLNAQISRVSSSQVSALSHF